MTDDVERAIEENATGPRKATGDSGSIEQHSLPDQIAAAKFSASKEAAQAKGLGIKLAKISPRETV